MTGEPPSLARSRSKGDAATFRCVIALVAMHAMARDRRTRVRGGWSRTGTKRPTSPRTPHRRC